MCRFKSGLIFKNRVILAPIYNESHSKLLEREGIEDSIFNAQKVFVRAELIPKSGILSDVNEWEYHVDQDIVPDWYGEDPKKCERMFREAVKDWRDKNIFDICGVPCTKLKEENGKTYCHVCEPLFDSTFGDNNNYKLSDVRNRVLTCGFANDLKEKYGDKLVPISMDLTSLDGLHDYGCLNGEDLLAIPNINLYRECRENVLCSDRSWWLSTPDSIPSGTGASYVLCVRDDGSAYWGCIGYARDVRPFFILKN